MGFLLWIIAGVVGTVLNHLFLLLGGLVVMAPIVAVCKLVEWVRRR